MNENYVIKAIDEFLLVIDGSVEDGKVGVMKKNSDEWIVKPEYEYVDYFSNESVFLCVNDSGVLILDKNGNKLGDTYNLAYGFIFGVCIVEKDSKLNIINKNGELLLNEWCASISYPIMEKRDGKLEYILSVSKDISLGEDSEFIKYKLIDNKIFEIK